MPSRKKNPAEVDNFAMALKFFKKAAMELIFI